MAKRLIYIVLCTFAAGICLYSFTANNPSLVVNKKDVVLKLPKGFPRPEYDFRGNKITPQGFMLGRKLFYDPILSKDSSISCGFCHQRIAAFAHIDHTLSHGINGLLGTRNVPPLQNLIWKKSLMWDGAVNHLEMQPLAPISNHVEMDESLKHVVYKLRRNSEYRAMFKAAFKDTLITSDNMLKAIAQFTGMMITSNSRYDRYLGGKEKLTADELKGLALFRAHCATCHTEPLFTNEDFANIGLVPDIRLKDSGRAKVTGDTADYMKFKVPSLRNVAMTYPYMHDGRFKTLQQVLNFYAAGKFYGDNYDKRIEKNVGLRDDDRKYIIAFLQTLTDKEFLYDRRFADPNFH